MRMSFASARDLEPPLAAGRLLLRRERALVVFKLIDVAQHQKLPVAQLRRGE